MKVAFFNYVFSNEVTQLVIEMCTINHVSSTAMEYQTLKGGKKTQVQILALGAALALRIMFFCQPEKEGKS